MTRDWQAWHRRYDDPASSLSRRLATVRALLGDELARRTPPPRTTAPVRLVSLCAGDGRDTLPVLARTTATVRATLVELDRTLARTAEQEARRLGLDCEVRVADAGSTDSVADLLPVDVLLLCGIFGNVSDADVETTIGSLPALLAGQALVLWTRGAGAEHDPTLLDGDPSLHVRSVFAAAGLEEVAFVRPTDAGFRVGAHRFTGTPAPHAPAGTRLFSFV